MSERSAERAASGSRTRAAVGAEGLDRCGSSGSRAQPELCSESTLAGVGAGESTLQASTEGKRDYSRLLTGWLLVGNRRAVSLYRHRVQGRRRRARRLVQDAQLETAVGHRSDPQGLPPAPEEQFDGEESPTTPAASQALTVSAAPLARREDVRPHFGPKQVLEYALSDVSVNTRLAYLKDVELFAAWLKTTPEAAVALLVGRGRGAANALVVDWLNSMREHGAQRERGLSPATRARRVTTLSAIVRAARRLELVEWALEVKRPKVRKYRDTRGPTREQAQLLLAVCATDTLEGLRNRAILLVVLTMGLRRHEVAAMRTGHFLEGERLRVLGKGEKLVEVPIPVETRLAIDRWLEAWQAAVPEDEDDLVVFRSLSSVSFGKALGPKGIYDVVRAIGESLEPPLSVWPHGLRHTAITAGLEETNGNIEAVSIFGRQDDPKVTMQYDDNRKDAGGVVAAKLGKVFGGSG